MQAEIKEIIEFLETYFIMLYEGDAETMEKVFHEGAHISFVDNGEVTIAGRDVLKQRIASRTSSKDAGVPREDNILSIDFINKDYAMVKVNLVIVDRLFTDYLSLIKNNGEWIIVSKTFYSEPIAK
ncbi:nuclear transport factor 2 family protein [Halodesulfovibrio sp.]|uniref:nuclear transport factor 2 family protein n=1 Tax=Halodesulfovibrio sp. TaxID=1912772 RepID=UPI0025BF3D18|nr:nuclear transport factor 2 family protein [Halodesulfovibrio sp.]